MTTPQKDTAPALLWFRDDLRLADNPALVAAVQSKRPLICVRIFDDELGPAGVTLGKTYPHPIVAHERAR